MAIPAAIRRILDGLPEAYRPKGWGKAEITLTLGTADRRTMAGEHVRIRAEVEARFASLRAGTRPLSQKDAVALAGEAYRAFAEGGEENPGSPEVWRRT
ncbi:MAG TPA: hypothetical protein VL996_01775, partial [Methylocella sp.]|nr:hypothetical protein [Methylocella sp.]